MTRPLPPQINRWFTARGWSIHPHQQDMLDRADAPCQLLIAPTGGGKTMAGFLPTLAEVIRLRRAAGQALAEGGF